MDNNTNMETAQAALAAKRAAKQNAAIQPLPTPPTAIVVKDPNAMTSLQVVTNAASLEKLGETFAMSGFFGAVSKSTATAALINCVLEGLSPIEYKAKYHTMDNGTTAIKSDYIQREFHRLGGGWKFNEWTAEVCDITFTYHGQELRGRVTLDEFKRNGVALGKDGKTLKKNWSQFPREMLKARCMATYIRALCPEALGGMYTQEEAADFTQASAPKVVQGVASPSPLAPPPPPKPTAPAAAPIVPEVLEPEPIDATVCPCGKSKGKRFDELPTATLERILENAAKYPAVTDAHKAAIIAEIERRENAQE